MPRTLDVYLSDTKAGVLEQADDAQLGFTYDRDYLDTKAAKNYALLYRQDVLCTAAYPRLSKNMAMRIGGRSLPDTIHLEQWHSLVASTQAARRLLATDLAKMANTIEAEADTLLSELGEGRPLPPVLKTVRKMIGTRAALVLRALDKTG